MAIQYASSGAGVSTETSGAALSPACPATVNAGDILILHTAWEGTTSAPSPPGDWTLLSGPQDVGTGTVVARHWVYGKIADGSEDGATVALGSPAVTTQRAARIHRFTGRVAGTISQLVPAASFTAFAGTTDPTGPTVTTTVAGALACALVYQNDNNTLETFAGASDTWTERGTAGGYIFALTPGGVLDLLTATPAADPGTVSGGAMTVTNDPWGVIGFEIRPSVPATIEPVGQATETDTANAVAHSRAKPVAQAVEADTAQTIVRGSNDRAGRFSWAELEAPIPAVALIEPVGQALETDTANQITPKRTRAIGQTLETDTAQPVGRVKTEGTGQAQETDTAQPVGHSKTVHVGQVVETDTAQSTSTAQNRAGRFSWAELEVPSADVGDLVAVAQAVETDTANAVTPERTYPVGQAAETDTAQTVTPSQETVVNVGQAQETDTANPVTPERTYPVGQAQETDTAQAVGAALTRAPRMAAAGLVWLWGDLDSAIGQAEETDTAQEITPERTYPVGQAQETDTAQPVGRSKSVTIGQAEETDTAVQIAAAGALSIGQPVETDTANPVTARKTRAVGQASSTDTAQPVGHFKTKQVGQATETDTATAVAHSGSLTVGQATSTDTAGAVTANRSRTVAIGQAEETDTATATGHYKTRPVGQATSTDTAFAVDARIASDATPPETSRTNARTRARGRTKTTTASGQTHVTTSGD